MLYFGKGIQLLSLELVNQLSKSISEDLISAHWSRTYSSRFSLKRYESLKRVSVCFDKRSQVFCN